MTVILVLAVFVICFLVIERLARRRIGAIVIRSYNLRPSEETIWHALVHPYMTAKDPVARRTVGVWVAFFVRFEMDDREKDLCLEHPDYIEIRRQRLDDLVHELAQLDDAKLNKSYRLMRECLALGRVLPELDEILGHAKLGTEQVSLPK